MKFNRIYEDFSLILKRAQVVYVLTGILFVLLVLAYWKVQILDHWKFWAQSEANRIRAVSIPAPRGAILDRNGIILADNVASFKASIVRETSRDLSQSLAAISPLLNVEQAVLQKRLEKFASLPNFQPAVIKDNLTLEEVSRIESRRFDLPELIVEAEPKRYYPFGDLAAHAIGYLQEISQDDLKTDVVKGKGMGDLVGKTGLERQYQNLLVGQDGSLMEIVDSIGRKRGEYGRIDPVQGNNLHISLDFEIQMKARELLDGREGAIVVLDPRNGEILAMANYPTFDPNKFISRFTLEEWLTLVNRDDHPLENRAIRGLYSPGSIFKLAMALAGLNSGVITSNTGFFCGGGVEFYGRIFKCLVAHGTLNLPEAIRNSCNVYFYNLAQRLGIDRIADYGAVLGIGQKTGVDIPGEKEGAVPTQEWRKNERKTVWYGGETLSVGIGQGPILTTPLQIAVHTALIANRGVRTAPHFLMSYTTPDKASVAFETARPNPDRVNITKETFEAVVEGMWKSVNMEGTGRRARIDGFDVCGKTGSTQVIGRETAEKLGKQIKTHSWFTGFAPRSNPRVVVTVLVEYGGMGGAIAAPLAKELFDIVMKKYVR